VEKPVTIDPAVFGEPPLSLPSSLQQQQQQQQQHFSNVIRARDVSWEWRDATSSRGFHSSSQLAPSGRITCRAEAYTKSHE